MFDITRRDMVKVSAVAMAGVGAISVASAVADEGGCTFEQTIAWNAEYDVIVIGFGGAGACSAITAADEGAKVLLVDKAPLHCEGGNTRYCEQWIKHFDEGEKGLQYVRNQSATMDHMTEEINRLIYDGCNANCDWLVEKGICTPESLYEYFGVEYPDFKGAVGAGLSSLIISSEATKGFWVGIRQAVVDRAESIDVWLASPGKRLIQDPQTKTIVGVVIEHGGEDLNVHAKNGVVLACGGFENNDFMMENFQNRGAIYPFGTEFNTGDGLTMAAAVGAQLWHTGTLSGPFMTPMYEGRCYFSSMYQNFFNAEPCILVGPDGNRFTNDAGWSRHGHRPVGGDWLPQQTPTRMWAIFDETARTSGNNLCKYFSRTLEDEIASGQIVQADTIEGLAAMIGLDDEGYYYPENGEFGWEGYDETHRPSGLAKTVERYNSYCAAGYDPEFCVNPKFLAPIETPPFYAIEMFAACVNTQGGAKRDLNCQIVDAFDEPIPRLYGAGEFGSFYGGVYDGGGNISECMFSGRLAGAGAAVPKDDLPVVAGYVPAESAIASYGSDPLEDPDAEPQGANEYIGKAIGLGGILQVGVTVEEGAMTAVRVASHGETPAIGGKALAALPEMAVAAGTPEIDLIAGATITTEAFKKALRDALTQAGVELGEAGAMANASLRTSGVE